MKLILIRRRCQRTCYDEPRCNHVRQQRHVERPSKRSRSPPWSVRLNTVAPPLRSVRLNAVAPPCVTRKGDISLQGVKDSSNTA